LGPSDQFAATPAALTASRSSARTRGYNSPSGDQRFAADWTVNSRTEVSASHHSLAALALKQETFMKRDLVTEILALPVDERIGLVEAIWDSIAATPEALPLSPQHREELDRRLAELEADPDSGIAPEEAFARIRRGS
jgi:putative addiction module component (TIGR02574 family)